MVMQLPERDKLSMSYEQMTSRLAICMGGRVSEEIVFGKQKITSGAQSDIEQATNLARAMVTRWGFSVELGTVMYGAIISRRFSSAIHGASADHLRGHRAEDRCGSAAAGGGGSCRSDEDHYREARRILILSPRVSSNMRR